MKLAIVLGTGRVGAVSAGVAAYVVEVAKKAGHEVAFVDCGKLGVTRTEETNAFTEAWSATVLACEGILIVSPEYNHGYPGELKMLLDSAYAEYQHKPVGIIGVSNGPIGGARMMEQLRQVAIAFQMIPAKNAVYFANSKLGVIDMAQEKRIIGLIDELAWYARAR